MDFNTTYKILLNNLIENSKNKESETARTTHDHNIASINRNHQINIEAERKNYNIRKDKINDKIEKQKQSKFRQVLLALNQ